MTTSAVQSHASDRFTTPSLPRSSKCLLSAATFVTSRVVLHVLLLDGFDESRDRTAAVLRSSGFTVTAVAEEEDVLGTLDGDAPVDVVILDIPIDEAIEAAIAIRARPRSPKLLALIEPSDSRRRDAAREAGVDFVLLRPCPPAHLAKHIVRFGQSNPSGR